MSKKKAHPLADWKYEVANGDTTLGYGEWLEHQMESARHTLERLTVEVAIERTAKFVKNKRK